MLDFWRYLGSAVEKKGQEYAEKRLFGLGGGGGGGHFSKQPLVIEPVRHSVSKGLMLISASVSVNFFRVVLLYNQEP